MADKIVVLHAGRIEQVGSPLELYRTPRNTFVAGFIGSPKMNLLTGAVAKARGVETIGIRPEHVAVSKDSGEWQGRVTVAEHLGSDTFLHVNSDHGGMTVRVGGQMNVGHGDTIWMTPDANHLHRFGADGVRIA